MRLYPDWKLWSNCDCLGCEGRGMQTTIWISFRWKFWMYILIESTIKKFLVMIFLTIYMNDFLIGAWCLVQVQHLMLTGAPIRLLPQVLQTIWYMSARLVKTTLHKLLLDTRFIPETLFCNTTLHTATFYSWEELVPYIFAKSYKGWQGFLESSG